MLSANGKRFIKKANKKFNNKYTYDVSNYRGMTKNMTMICPIHGEFKQKPIVHIRSPFGCRSCSKKIKVTKKEFLKRIKLKYKNEYDLKLIKYVDRMTPVKLICKKHGVFTILPKALLRYSDHKGCQKCSKERVITHMTKTNSKFIFDAINKHGNRYDYSKTKYTKDNNKVIVICKKHGEFKQLATSHLQGHGCPKCGAGLSKGENRIASILSEKNIRYIQEYKIKKYRYRYDFYLPDYNILLEYDGKQHFLKSSWGGLDELKKIQKRDKIKNIIAANEKYRLVRISYLEYDKIEMRINEMINNEDIEYGAVVYSDGSAKPARGFYGSGAHGYMYDLDKLDTKTGDKPNNYIITDGGYLETNLAQKTEYHTVTPVHYINGYASFKDVGTNNTGELYGLIFIMRNLLDSEYNIKSIILKTDSTYAIGVYTKSDTVDWRSRNLANPEYYEIIEKLKNECKDRGISLKIVDVEAHSTILGNNIADRLAFLGRNLSSLRKVNKEEFIFTEAKRYWKPKIEKHPMIPFRNLFFINGATEKPMYVIFNYKTDVEPGKKSHEASFGLVYPTKPIREVDYVTHNYMKFGDKINIISKLNLDVLYSQFVQTYIKLFGDKVFTYNHIGRKYMSVLEGEPVCTEVHPAGLANTAYEKVIRLDVCLKDYYSKTNGSCTLQDITDVIYDDVTKGKVSSKLIKIDNVTKFITIEHITKDGNKITIPLQFDKDMIPRNSLKKLEKLQPIITLLVYEVSKTCIEYYVVIETLENKDISIWCNMFSNKVYLPIKK